MNFRSVRGRAQHSGAPIASTPVASRPELVLRLVPIAQSHRAELDVAAEPQARLGLSALGADVPVLHVARPFAPATHALLAVRGALLGHGEPQPVPKDARRLDAPLLHQADPARTPRQCETCHLAPPLCGAVASSCEDGIAPCHS
eukprot:scaffold4097_cov306-Pinguiococcus_pyrenoidosus.AAC.11